jgi:hypothetical protein
MAASSDVIARKVESLGMAMLRPSQGLEALERVLSSPALPGRALGAMGAAARLPPPVAPAVPFRWRVLFRGGRQAPELFEEVRVDFESRQRHQPAVAGTGKQGTSATSQMARLAAAGAAAEPARELEGRALREVLEAVAGVLGRQVGLAVRARGLPGPAIMIVVKLASGLVSLGELFKGLHYVMLQCIVHVKPRRRHETSRLYCPD